MLWEPLVLQPYWAPFKKKKKEPIDAAMNECFKITQTLGPNINNFPSKRNMFHELSWTLNPKHVSQISSMVKFQISFNNVSLFRIK
jgi:hypothetical protein